MRKKSVICLAAISILLFSLGLRLFSTKSMGVSAYDALNDSVSTDEIEPEESSDGKEFSFLVKSGATEKYQGINEKDVQYSRTAYIFDATSISSLAFYKTYGVMKKYSSARIKECAYSDLNNCLNLWKKSCKYDCAYDHGNGKYSTKENLPEGVEGEESDDISSFSPGYIVTLSYFRFKEESDNRVVSVGLYRIDNKEKTNNVLIDSQFNNHTVLENLDFPYMFDYYGPSDIFQFVDMDTVRTVLPTIEPIVSKSDSCFSDSLSVIKKNGSLWSLYNKYRKNKKKPRKITTNVKKTITFRSSASDNSTRCSLVLKNDGKLWLYVFIKNKTIKKRIASGVKKFYYNDEAEESDYVWVIDEHNNLYRYKIKVVYNYKKTNSYWTDSEDIIGVRSVKKQKKKITSHAKEFYYTENGSYYLIKTDSTLWVWGNNGYFQLGLGDKKSRKKPVKIMDHIIEVAVMAYDSFTNHGPFCCALDDKGFLYGWGRCEDNCCQFYPMIRRTNYVKTPTIIATDVTKVRAGDQTVVYSKKDLSLWTMGLLLDNSSDSDNVKIADHVKQFSMGYFPHYGYSLSYIDETNSLYYLFRGYKKPKKADSDVNYVFGLDTGGDLLGYYIKNDGKLWNLSYTWKKDAIKLKKKKVLSGMPTG